MLVVSPRCISISTPIHLTLNVYLSTPVIISHHRNVRFINFAKFSVLNRQLYLSNNRAINLTYIDEYTSTGLITGDIIIYYMIFLFKTQSLFYYKIFQPMNFFKIMIIYFVKQIVDIIFHTKKLTEGGFILLRKFIGVFNEKK